MNFRLDFLKKQMLNLKQNLLVFGLHFLGSSDCNFLLSISFDVFTEYSILCLPQLLISVLLKISKMLKKFLNFLIFSRNGTPEVPVARGSLVQNASVGRLCVLLSRRFHPRIPPLLDRKSFTQKMF
jgi:hypothetical protein